MWVAQISTPCLPLLPVLPLCFVLSTMRDVVGQFRSPSPPFAIPSLFSLFRTRENLIHCKPKMLDYYKKRTPSHFHISPFLKYNIQSCPLPGALHLQVAHLPANRLALTNRVYLSPHNLNALKAAMPPEAAGTMPLVTVGRHPYAAEAHPAVDNGSIALNGLHRRYAQLSLAAKVVVRPFVPPPNFALATLEITVDLLAKRSQQGPSRAPPREIDTDRLAQDVLINFEGQIFEIGRVLAMDFDKFNPFPEAIESNGAELQNVIAKTEEIRSNAIGGNDRNIHLWRD